jgi:hypothetical protein
MSETIGKILKKMGNGKAFSIGKNDFFNVDAKVLEPFKEGDNVKIIWEKKGMARFVTKMEKSSDTQAASQSAPEPPATEQKHNTGWQPKAGGYDPKEDHPNKALAIRIGNALNAAAFVMSNPSIIIQRESEADTLEAFTQATLQMAIRFFDFLENKNKELKS